MSASQSSTIAFYSPGWPPGQVQNGIVSYLGYLAPALRALGVDTRFVVSHDSSTAPPHADVDLGQQRQPRARRGVLRTLRNIPGARSEGRELGWAIIQGLRTLQARCRLDAVEMEESFGAAWFLQHVLDVPIIVRLHGPRFLTDVGGVAANAAVKRIADEERRCIAAAVGITVPSRDTLARVREHYGLPLAQACVIPNPVVAVAPERRWNLNASDGKSILFVGRFERLKGGDLVIDAFRAVAETIPQAELIFVGPDRGFSDDAGKTYDLPGYIAARLPPAVQQRVKVLGALPAEQIEPLRRQAFVTVAPSRFEVFGLALAEALAFGCPTIAADAGGMPEVLRADETGLLCPSGDAAALAAKICVMFQQPGRAAGYGQQAAVDMATRLAPESVARATLDHHRDIWTRPRGGAQSIRRSIRERLAYAITNLP